MGESAVRIERARADLAEACAALVGDVFVASSVLHRALRFDEAAYRSHVREHAAAMIDRGLSLVAVDERSRRVVGCLLACDLDDQPVASGERVAGLEPLGALLRALEDDYRRRRPPGDGRRLLVDMAAVAPRAASRGVYRELREAAHDVGRAAGFRRVVGELSAAATQHVCVRRFGHRVRAEIRYADFELRGARPFAGITDPPSIQLVEGRLA